jgi:cytochrome P450
MTLADDRPVKVPPPAPPPSGDPHPEHRRLLSGQPVVQAELPDGELAWLVGGYEEARQVVADLRFSRARAVAPGRSLRGTEVFAAGSINGLDPPEHTRLRKLVASAFTVRRVEALRPRVTGIVGELIDQMLNGPRPAQLVAAFAVPLPVQVICEMLGVPDADMPQFRAWSDTVLGDWQRDSELIMTALAGMFGYFAELIELKRAQPGDDLLTALIAARDNDDRLSETELTSLGCILLLAGHETTANQISLSLVTLLRHPGELARLLAEPALIPSAVEELLRFVSLGGGLPPARMATEDVELGGVTVRAGDVVLPMYATANRDPAEFPDPDQLDVSRRIVNHLAFGAGAHHCLGAQLARLELQEAFRGLLSKLPGLRAAVPLEQLKYKPGMAVYSLRELPVTWDAPGAAAQA